MRITPTDTTIGVLLDSGYYKVPRFQRPYSWDRENVEDFWQDAITSEDEDYFIGSFVFWADSANDNLFYIVDGQQRIITITLLLAALRNSLGKIGENELAAGMHKLIENRDINHNLKFVLQSVTPYPYLQEYIQKFGEPQVPISLGKEETALKSSFDYLTAVVSSLLGSVDSDPTIASDKKNIKKLEALLEVRDKILKLKLIVVKLDNEDDAYLVFETLNTRGKNLTAADLVKNLLTRLMRPTNPDVDLAKDKWLSIQKNFNASEVDININTFILYSWISRYPYTSAAKLFREIKGHVANSGIAARFLDDLIDDSITFRKLVEPMAFNWDREYKSITNSIRALNIFRVAQPLPMMIALLRDVENDNITKRQANRAFVILEKFHAQFTAITSQRIGGGTARLYASSAQQLYEATDNNARNIVIRNFISKLQSRKPSFEEYQVNFSELFFTSSQPRQKGLVRYILSALDKHFRGSSTGIDYESYSIEHLAPESEGGNGAIGQEVIGLMGNMILVTQDINERLGTKPIEEKIAIMNEAGVPIDDTLANATQWTEEIIKQRTTELASLTYKTIFHF